MADLITVEDYKLYTNRNYASREAANENDLYFSNLLIPGLSHAFEQYFDNDFQSISRTETFSVDKARTRTLFPRYKPISSITSVTIDTTLLDTDSYKLRTDINGLVLSSATNLPGQIIESYYWPRGTNNVVIVYVGGLAILRKHKYLICAFMARIDKSFASIADAQDEVFRELSAPENALLESTFRNIRL